MEQESEWNAAQNIFISEDLVTAAKNQLQFLAVVDRNRWLYETQTLQWAIYRYNACWLPLLAKHSKSKVTQGPLVVPLDCEWVWHCHRLNPVRYKTDSEEIYGRILDNCNVVSSIQETSRKETEEIWNNLYPNEPYDFDMSRASSSQFSETLYGSQNYSKYDFTLGIQRQTSFFYQVSRPHFKKDLFLEEAVARYKGFLHLIRRNREKSLRRFCVPTYDVDLMWHTHQLHPVSYCKDLVKLLGKVLEHDDTDQNRSKGQKLDTGFSDTTKQWEETFGVRYWRAGVMYRGGAPSPITTTPCIPDIVPNNADSANGLERLIDLPKTSFIEILLEFPEIKNLPLTNNEKVNVIFSKSQPDGIFNTKNKKLTIQSQSPQKQVATFQCEPNGYLYFEVITTSKNPTTLGTCFISLEEFNGKLSLEKWLDLVPITSEPVQLKVAASCTFPIPTPQAVQMLLQPKKSSCSFPCIMVRFDKSGTRFLDASGDEIVRLQMRDMKKSKSGEIVGFTKEGEKETVVLGRFVGQKWSLMDSLWSLTNNKDSHFLLTGPHMVKLVDGRKLDYELKHHDDKRRKEHDYMTAVEFSEEYPYGKAVGLLDLKSGVLVVQEEWFVLPGILSAFIVSKGRT